MALMGVEREEIAHPPAMLYTPTAQAPAAEVWDPLPASVPAKAYRLGALGGPDWPRGPCSCMLALSAALAQVIDFFYPQLNADQRQADAERYLAPLHSLI